MAFQFTYPRKGQRYTLLLDGGLLKGQLAPHCEIKRANQGHLVFSGAIFHKLSPFWP